MKRKIYFSLVTLQVAVLVVIIGYRLTRPALEVTAELAPANWTHVEDVLLPSLVFDVEPNYYLLKWDREMLFFYRLLWTEPSPVIKGYLGGKALVLSLSPLQDQGMRNLKKFCADDIAFTPSGETIVLATIEEPSRQPGGESAISQLFLVYNSAGRLVRKFEVTPYRFYSIAVADDSTLWAFGYKIGVPRNKDYPMLVKLSLEGRVLGGFHSRTLHSPDEKVVASRPFGAPKLFVQDSRVGLWVAAAGEFFEYNIDGQLIQKLSFKERLLSLGQHLGRDGRVEVTFLGWHRSDRFLAQVRTTKDLGDFWEIDFRTYELNGARQWIQLGPSTALPSPGRILALDSSGRVICVRHGSKQEPLMTIYDPA